MNKIIGLVLAFPMLAAAGTFDIDVRHPLKLDPAEEPITARRLSASDPRDGYVFGYIGPEDLSWKGEQRRQEDRVNNEAYLVRRLGPGKLSVREAVATANAAVEIANALLSQIYLPDKLEGQRPFICRRVREFWVIEGRQNPGTTTHLYIALQAATGECVSIREVGANLLSELSVPGPMLPPSFSPTLQPPTSVFPWPFSSVQ